MEFKLVFENEHRKYIISKSFKIGLNYIKKLREELKDNSITEKHIVFDKTNYLNIYEPSMIINKTGVLISTNLDMIPDLNTSGDENSWFGETSQEKINLIIDDKEYPFNKYVSLKYTVHYKTRFIFFSKIEKIVPYIYLDTNRMLQDWILSGCPRNYKIRGE